MLVVGETHEDAEPGGTEGSPPPYDGTSEGYQASRTAL
jgi:hypothetical protein